MYTNTRTGFPRVVVGAAGALAIALGLLPLAGRTPEVAGALLTASVFAAIPSSRSSPRYSPGGLRHAGAGTRRAMAPSPGSSSASVCCSGR